MAGALQRVADIVISVGRFRFEYYYVRRMRGGGGWVVEIYERIRRRVLRQYKIRRI